MLKMTIGNSSCNIIGLSSNQFNDLRILLSYETSPVKTKFSRGKYCSQTKYLMDKKGNFPTGLLYLVKEYLRSVDLDTNDTRPIPIASGHTFKLDLGHAPYPEQIDASVAAKSFKRGIIVAPTGFGKSAIIALIIEKLQVKTLVVVPSLELKKQLTETLTKVFGSLHMITIQNIDSIKERAHYDCLIIDEFHHSGAASYRKLNQTHWNGIYYKFGLTATPFRSQDNERLLLESVLSEVIYEVDYQTAVAREYIVPLKAYYITVPITSIKGNPKSWPSMYSELVVNNKARTEQVRKLLLKLSTDNRATICLVKEIQHGLWISTDQFGFVNGQSDERYLIDAFNSGRLTTLIGTDSILGEGVDTKPAEYVVIAGLGKSRNRFMQGCGRGFRVYPDKKSCKVIIFKDISHKWTLNHFKEQCKILKEEYNVVPIELEL